MAFSLATHPSWVATQPACDMTQTPDQYCEAFCTGRCNFHNKSFGETGTATNMTLYRLTPRNVEGIANHNTGDVPGDVGFVLANRQKVLECLQNETQRGCFLDNSTDNVYGAFDVEVDGQIGPYFQCNPLYQNASNPFQCWQKCETPPDCHNQSGYDSWTNGTDGWAGPTCFCEKCERCNKTVGRAPNPYTYHGSVPKGWPRQCYSFDEAPPPPNSGGTCLKGKVWKTVTGQNLPSVLEEICDLCDYRSPCEAFTVINSTSAKVFTKVSSNHTAPPGTTCVSGTWGDHWGGSVGIPIGGLWYSTPAAGLCPQGAALGTNGCTWRYRNANKPGRYVNSGCVDERVDAAVEAHGRPCFSGCAQPSNKTSLCYSTCYAATLEGDPMHNITAMDARQVTEPWKDAFLPVAQGGCQELQPQEARH